MVNELQARLHSLYNGRTLLGGIRPQTCGQELYRVTATGEQLYTLLEASDRVAQLEAAIKSVLKHDHVIGQDYVSGNFIIYRAGCPACDWQQTLRTALGSTAETPVKPACQHDLLRPDPTVRVEWDAEESYMSGRCSSCGHSWNIPWDSEANRGEKR